MCHSVGQIRDGGHGRELGIPVADNGSAGDDGAGPELDDAEAVDEDRHRRIRSRELRSHIGEFVPEVGDDGHHAVEGAVGEVEEFLEVEFEAHPASLRTRRNDRLAGLARPLTSPHVRATRTGLDAARRQMDALSP